MALVEKSSARIEMLDWLKGCAIIAVVLDHLEIVREPYVMWSVNLFVLVTAFIYSQPGYFFSFRKMILKVLQLLYLTASAVLLIKGLNVILHIPNSQPVLSVFLSPYAFFVHNHYLGDIWYIALHLQFLVLFYFCLKYRVFLKPARVFWTAALVNGLSMFLTYIVLQRFHTIFITSWLIFLAAGFYGMRLFLGIIGDFPHNRWVGGGAGLGVLLSFYGLYPLFPWFFTNNNRALFINLPFYTALVLFLAESYFLLEGIKAGRVLKSAVYGLGRHSLAIYLTHEPFSFLWARIFPSSFLVTVLCVLSGIAFGVIADWIFLKGKKAFQKMKKPGTDYAVSQRFPAGAAPVRIYDER